MNRTVFELEGDPGELVGFHILESLFQNGKRRKNQRVEKTTESASDRPRSKEFLRAKIDLPLLVT